MPRQDHGLAKVFVKNASVELIDLYRRFVSPDNPRFLPLLPFYHLSWSAGLLLPGTVLYITVLNGALRIWFFPSSCA